jgi:hypothetical protein
VDQAHRHRAAPALFQDQQARERTAPTKFSNSRVPATMQTHGLPLRSPRQVDPMRRIRRSCSGMPAHAWGAWLGPGGLESCRRLQLRAHPVRLPVGRRARRRVGAGVARVGLLALPVEEQPAQQARRARSSTHDAFGFFCNNCRKVCCQKRWRFPLSFLTGCQYLQTYPHETARRQAGCSHRSR